MRNFFHDLHPDGGHPAYGELALVLARAPVGNLRRHQLFIIIEIAQDIEDVLRGVIDVNYFTFDAGHKKLVFSYCVVK